MTTTFTTTVDSPVGQLLLTSDGESLTRLLFAAAPDPDWSTEPCAVLDRAVAQLAEYFAGERTDFDLPLEPAGTPFQLTVWQALRDIPYAETINYGQLALRVGNAKASRAVGLANGRNPISIVVPCHRVIGADGSLTGYGGGLDRKRTLLDLERRTAGHEDPQLSLL
ncbi:MAG TPA: methylated-DNA--[protein]-cysteine S-methyltransferase [Actinomycetes bacterium]